MRKGISVLSRFFGRAWGRVLPWVPLTLIAALPSYSQTCGFQWKWLNPVPSGAILQSLTEGPSAFVAGGTYGNVVMSADGQNWVHCSPFTTDPILRLVWGNGRYLAAAGPDFSQCFFWESQDGVEWRPIPGPKPPLGFLVFEGGLFFNLRGDRMSVSTDGAVWTDVPLGDPVTYLTDLTYGSGTYVALADEGAIFTSVDGVHWTQRRTADQPSLWCLAYGNGVFVAAGSEGRILTSPDGATWTEQAPLGTEDLYFLSFSGGRFFAYSPGNNLFSSPDGIHWVEQTAPFQILYGMVGSGAMAVSIGADSDPVKGLFPGLSISRDGFTWTRVDFTPTREDLFAVARGGSPVRTVAVGNAGTLLVSSAGGSFERVQVPFPADLRGVAWGNGRFVAVGSGGAILTSEDAETWEQRPLALTSDLTSVHWLNGLFLCTGTGGTLLTSPDGLAWTAHPVPTQADLLSAAWGNGRYVVAGANSTLLSSPDAVQWSLRYEDPWPGQWIWGVAFGNGTFCALTNGDLTGFVSDDGDTWQRVSTGITAMDVVFWQGQFVACAGSGTLCFVSSDGRSWFDLDSTGGTILRSLAGAGDSLLAVGERGAVLTAACGPGITRISPPHASTRGGDTVTVTGMHLTGADAVYFGSEPALSLDVISDGRVDVVAPPSGAGMTTLRLHGPAGFSPFSGACGFEYIPPPLLLSVHPEKVSVLGGDWVTLRGQDFLASDVYIDGFPVPSNPISLSELSAQVFPHPAGPVDVEVRNYDGQRSVLPAALTYVEPPIILSVTVIWQPSFRLKIEGTNFHPGCMVLVNDTPAPKSKFKSETRVLASGSSVAKLFKKPYYQVDVQVVNTDDGVSSPRFSVHKP